MNSSIDELSRVLINLIRVGAIFRFTYCAMQLKNEEEHASYKKRMKHVVIFYVLAELIFEIKEIAMHYYG